MFFLINHFPDELGVIEIGRYSKKPLMSFLIMHNNNTNKKVIISNRKCEKIIKNKVINLHYSTYNVFFLFFILEKRERPTRDITYRKINWIWRQKSSSI